VPEDFNSSRFAGLIEVQWFNSSKVQGEKKINVG
jgi:hypothetical protein